jgi:hypothetical protein
MGTQSQADEDADEPSAPPKPLPTVKVKLTRTAGKVWKAAEASMMTAPVVPMEEASSDCNETKGVNKSAGA